MSKALRCARCGVADEFVKPSSTGPTHQSESACIKVLRAERANAKADVRFLIRAIDRWWSEGDNNALIIARRQVPNE